MNDINSSIKKYLYNELLSSVEEEVFQRTNPRFYKNQIGGYDNVSSYSSNGLIMPGKFEIIRNSFRMSLLDAILSSHERQLLFAETK